MIVRVVAAPDKFKGSLTAIEAAQAIRRGVLAAHPDADCKLCPMADGGEGTVDVFLQRGWQRRCVTVDGPLGDPVEAPFALQGDTAVLEMSSASGLKLLTPQRYDPLRADTYGTGQLITAALDAGAKHLIVGIGGSATNDAGTGMLRALGVRFFDGRGALIEGPMRAFDRLTRIDVSGMDARLEAVRIDVASDVDNPLCGPQGAAQTFAAQKGADADGIVALDAVLRHIADVAAVSVDRDCRDDPGAGAAGGLGFALMQFLDAKVEPGVKLVARQAGLDDLLRDADLCLTGEGKIDDQSLHGKTIVGVADLAKAHGVATIAFGGAVDRDAAAALQQRGVTAIQISPPDMPLERSMREAGALLQAAAEKALRDSAALPSKST